MILYRSIEFVDSNGGVVEIRVSHNGKPGCEHSASVTWREILNSNLNKMTNVRVLLPDPEDQP